jgi:hypothetical protein
MAESTTGTNRAPYESGERLASAPGSYQVNLPDGSPNQPADSSRTSLAESVIGQATAALAVTAAVIYAAGGLTLGLQLWFLGVPWTPVLGQLPRDFIGITAVGQVILPAVIAGAAFGGLIDWLSFRREPRARPRPAADRQPGYLTRPYWPEPGINFLLRTFVIALLCGGLLGTVPLVLLIFTQHPAAGALRPWIAIYACCALLSGVAFFIALYGLRFLYRHAHATSLAWRRTLVSAVTALALVPFFCSVSGAFLLPPVALCGPNFLHPVHDQARQSAGYMKGNLIGANSQWVYIAQFHYRGNVITGRTITVVPASSVQLQAIDGGCGDLVDK